MNAGPTIDCPHCRTRIKHGARYCPGCDADVLYGPNFIGGLVMATFIAGICWVTVWHFGLQSEVDSTLRRGMMYLRDWGVPLNMASVRLVIDYKWPILGAILLAIGVLKDARSIRVRRTYR